ncbi:hypothetical protein CEXT_333361 [Caerostris extrusa]|uniref:Uncharacterized protein n=1 Tax=Caerostris extrusa TaxID=172846 RepID=A0AAV4RET9_CAEEX|nr:hypothetical protein CEXT_333361 [Caerostris extrusa]
MITRNSSDATRNSTSDDSSLFITPDDSVDFLGRKTGGYPERVHFTKKASRYRFVETDARYRFVDTGTGHRFVDTDVGYIFVDTDTGHRFVDIDTGH